MKRLTKPEQDAVLAGLRMLQCHLENSHLPWYAASTPLHKAADIYACEHNDPHGEKLDIDNLAERINLATVDLAIVKAKVEKIMYECRKCGMVIVRDSHGSWRDCTDGDCCNEDNQTHQPKNDRENRS